MKTVAAKARLKKMWAGIAIAVVVIAVGGTYANNAFNRSNCESRWGQTTKNVTYNYKTGCLVEYPADSGKMVPEVTIRLNEPAVKPQEITSETMEGSKK